MKRWFCLLAVLTALATVAEDAKKSMFVPDFKHVQYGPHERQILNLYLTNKKDPAPLLIYIHGGGWRHGDGAVDADNGQMDRMIWDYTQRGISVAVISYRLTPLPDPVYDAARAVQFLRLNAQKFHLRKDRFAATGFSAGATTSLWLALHDDLADPRAEDPVLRESTRLSAALAAGAQTSIDPVTLRAWGLGEAVGHYMIPGCMGFKNVEEMDKNYESKKAMYREFSPVTHIDSGDPEIRVTAGDLKRKGNWIHHGLFGAKLKERADQVGARCEAEGISKLKDRRGPDFIERILCGDDKKTK